MRPKKSKTWDMNMHWLRDKEVLKHIRVYWDKGKNNYADYFTNHFPPIDHRQQIPCYIQSDHLATKLKYMSQTELTRLCEGVLNRFLSPSVLYPKSQSRNHKLNQVLCTKSNRVLCIQYTYTPIRATTIYDVQDHN